IGASRLKEPQSGVDRVVFWCFTGIGKTVRQHSLIYMFREGAQDAARNFIFSSRKSKTGQGDHGVATPVAEPVVASNDRFVFSTGSDVLVGRGDEAPYEAILNPRCTVGVLATCDLSLPILRHLGDIVLTRRGNDRPLTATAHVKTQDKRIEQVFAEIETAFPFNVILKVPVPIARFSQFHSIVR